MPVASRPLALLDFDPKNPRLPEDVIGASQDVLLSYMAQNYEPLEIARSIALHGYFASEPLIVIPSGARFTVVEGNRRLAALRILADPSIARRLDLADAAEWEQLAADASIEDEVPVVLANNRRIVAPIIGYRHISGIEPWDPWAKARFLAQLVDEDRLSFEEAASEVGEREKDVRAHYRNYRIVRQARDQFGIDTRPVELLFGVFTRAMQDSRIAKFVGAPSPDAVRSSVVPLAATSRPRIKELVSWVFGGEGVQPLFTDSRRISDLGSILASSDALSILRSTRDMTEAFGASGGLRERCLRRLNDAAVSLEAARQDIADFADDNEVQEAVARCVAIATELEGLI